MPNSLNEIVFYQYILACVSRLDYSRGHNNLQTIVYCFLCLILCTRVCATDNLPDCIIYITTLLNLKLYYHYC